MGKFLSAVIVLAMFGVSFCLSAGVVNKNIHNFNFNSSSRAFA